MPFLSEQTHSGIALTSSKWYSRKGIEQCLMQDVIYALQYFLFLLAGINEYFNHQIKSKTSKLLGLHSQFWLKWHRFYEHMELCCT